MARHHQHLPWDGDGESSLTLTGGDPVPHTARGLLSNALPKPSSPSPGSLLNGIFPELNKPSPTARHHSSAMQAGLTFCIRFNIGEPCKRSFCDAMRACSNISRRTGEVTQLSHICSALKDDDERCGENHAAFQNGRIHHKAQFTNELIPSTP